MRLVDAWRETAARTFFLNVWPMYVHELTGFDTDFYRLDPSGRWLPDIVEDWVAPQTPVANLRPSPLGPGVGPFQRAHVIEAGTVPVGFVCVGLPPFKYMPANVDVHVAELFVANPFRARGVGRRAVELLMNRYPGRWHLQAIHDNARAIRFWRHTLPSLQVRDLVEAAEARDVSWFFSIHSQSS